MIYFNEIDPFAVRWLRNLYPDAMVDERSIVDVQPRDVHNFERCHFFGGIAGWQYALNLAGWPGGRQVWTGSCPCQSFSVAGNRKGTADARHLWPAFGLLIRQCQPATVFGEQVASKLGRQWLNGVFVDLERMGYAVAGADLCAASAGAPHIRQRLFWVATRGMGEPRQPRLAERSSKPGDNGTKFSSTERAGGDAGGMQARFWDAFDLVQCRDEKWRRVPAGSTQPGVQPLANGVPARVGRLRGFGNAIVPQVAAEFIKAFLEAEGDMTS